MQLIGVGNEALVRKTAAEHNIPLDGIELVNCTETIEMCDEPARAIRQKKDSSIVVGLNMLKEGKDRILRHIVNAYRLIYQGNFSIQDALQKIEDQVPMSDEIHNILNFVRESKGIVK